MDFSKLATQGRALLPIVGLIAAKGKFAEAERDIDTLLAYSGYLPAFSSKDTALAAIKQLIAQNNAKQFKSALSNVVDLVLSLCDNQGDTDKVLAAFDALLGSAKS